MAGNISPQVEFFKPQFTPRNTVAWWPSVLNLRCFEECNQVILEFKLMLQGIFSLLPTGSQGNAGRERQARAAGRSGKHVCSALCNALLDMRLK